MIMSFALITKVKVTRSLTICEPADVELDEHGVGGSGVEHPKAVDERLSASMNQCADEVFTRANKTS